MCDTFLDSFQHNDHNPALGIPTSDYQVGAVRSPPSPTDSTQREVNGLHHQRMAQGVPGLWLFCGRSLPKLPGPHLFKGRFDRQTLSYLPFWFVFNLGSVSTRYRKMIIANCQQDLLLLGFFLLQIYCGLGVFFRGPFRPQCFHICTLSTPKN